MKTGFSGLIDSVSLPEYVLLNLCKGSEYVLIMLKKTAIMNEIVKIRDPISESRKIIYNVVSIPKQQNCRVIINDL